MSWKARSAEDRSSGSKSAALLKEDVSSLLAEPLPLLLPLLVVIDWTLDRAPAAEAADDDEVGLPLASIASA